MCMSYPWVMFRRQHELIYSILWQYDEYSGDDAIGVSQLQIFCSFPNGYEANNMVIGVSDYEPDGTWLREWSSV